MAGEKSGDALALGLKERGLSVREERCGDLWPDKSVRPVFHVRRGSFFERLLCAEGCRRDEHCG